MTGWLTDIAPCPPSLHFCQYDVVRTARDESGLLLYKGNEALLADAEAQGTWTYMGVGLADSGAVEHLIDAGDKCIRVAARRVVRVDGCFTRCIFILGDVYSSRFFLLVKL